ncbi:hypothetical protein, partial [uncultured Duncaniella sp.]
VTIFALCFHGIRFKVKKQQGCRDDSPVVCFSHTLPTTTSKKSIFSKKIHHSVNLSETAIVI